MSALAEHIDRPGARHRLTATDERRVFCHDCGATVELALTPTPPRGWDRPPPEECRPMPAGMRERVLAEIAARKTARQAPTDDERTET